MERLAALILMLVFTSGWITPLAFASAEPQLPACCRRDGKHRCAMQERAAAGYSLQSSAAKCAQYPTVKAVPAVGKIGLPVFHTAVVAPLANPAKALGQVEVRFHVSYSRCGQKRGPPALLA